MSFPPIINLLSYHRAKDASSLGTPDAAEAIKVASEFINSLSVNIRRGHQLGDGSGMIEAALQAAFAPPAIEPPPTPSVVPPKPSSLQGEDGTTNSQPPLVPFCAETPISQPTTPHPEPTSTPLGEGQAGKTPRAKGNPLPLQLYLGRVLTKGRGEPLPRLEPGLPSGNDMQTPVML
jgi:hypothetical protein